MIKTWYMLTQRYVAHLTLQPAKHKEDFVGEVIFGLIGRQIGIFQGGHGGSVGRSMQLWTSKNEAWW